MRHGIMVGLLTAGMMVAGVASADAVETEGHTPGKWTMDLEAATAYAKQHDLPLFVAFSGSDWCGWCKLMDRQVFQTEAWTGFATKSLVLVLLDFPQDKSLVPDHYVQRNNDLRDKFGVKGFPTYILLDAEAGTEIARFGAGRDKTPEMLIAEIREVLPDPAAAAAVPAQAVPGSQEEAIVQALRTFGNASPEKRKGLAAATLATLSETLKRDPVLLVLLDPRTMIGMIPYLDLGQLDVLADILNKARQSGTPTDRFMAELEQLADERKDDLATLRGLMFLHSGLGNPAKGLALLPELDVLKQVDTPENARELIVVLKRVGKPATALALALHMQQKAGAENQRREFCVEILNMADAADDAFLGNWLALVAADTALLDTLREALGRQAEQAGRSRNEKERTKLLKGHARIVNMLGQTAPDKRMSRLYLRYWQFEFANSLSHYRTGSAGPAASRTPQSQAAPPPFVPFRVLLECRLTPPCMALLPPPEAVLHEFQVAVARLKTGLFDEDALMALCAFNDRYPESVSRHCAAFIEDWGRKVNPNKVPDPRARQFGSRSVPAGIPLTRARQEKNITDCARIFGIAHSAGVKLPDDVKLAGFRSCFSRAEIVSRDAVLRVFPEVSALSDDFMVKLAAGVIGELRENWMNAENRQALQQQYATNRTEKDIDNETVRAYRGMIDLVGERLALSETSIPLRNIMAALSFDLAEFSKAAGLAGLEEYTELRDATFRMFEECYKIYQAGLPGLGGGQYSVDYLKYWFSAVFGASDLGALTVDLEGDLTQLERIKATLDTMADPYRDAHKTLFGEWIVGEWPKLKPHVKLKVMQATLEVLGNHDSVASLVELMEKYRGLLREVELRAEVDGSTRVGFGRPFGLILKLRHTDALEREAGSFSKYIQNQGQSFPGAGPRIDYRNNFAANIGKALREHFEIVGITWMDNSVHSVETELPHWRETPLAYLTLKTLDGTVDRIPSIQLDMDFTDDTGQVVLPVLANTVIIDGGVEDAPARPVNDLEIRLQLDARKAAEGEIRLDVKMKGEGILPSPLAILRPAAGYSFGAAVDAESLVLKLDQRGRQIVPFSEQSTTLDVKRSGVQPIREFTFPEVDFAGARVVLEQYRDADILPAPGTVSLDKAQSAAWLAGFGVLALLAAAVAALGVFLVVRRRRGAEESSGPSFVLPGEINGLSVVSFLERIRRSGRLASAEESAALAADVRTIEEACFSADRTKDIDLKTIAAKWLQRVC